MDLSKHSCTREDTRPRGLNSSYDVITLSEDDTRKKGRIISLFSANLEMFEQKTIGTIAQILNGFKKIWSQYGFKRIRNYSRKKL